MATRLVVSEGIPLPYCALHGSTMTRKSVYGKPSMQVGWLHAGEPNANEASRGKQGTGEVCRSA